VLGCSKELPIRRSSRPTHALLPPMLKAQQIRSEMPLPLPSQPGPRPRLGSARWTARWCHTAPSIPEFARASRVSCPACCPGRQPRRSPAQVSPPPCRASGACGLATATCMPPLLTPTALRLHCNITRDKRRASVARSDPTGPAQNQESAGGGQQRRQMERQRPSPAGGGRHALVLSRGRGEAQRGFPMHTQRRPEARRPAGWLLFWFGRSNAWRRQDSASSLVAARVLLV
jgi:hypothetical protein